MGAGNFSQRLLPTGIATDAAIASGLFENSLEQKTRFSVAIDDGHFNRFLPHPEKVAQPVMPVARSLDAMKTHRSLRGTFKSQVLVRVLINDRARCRVYWIGLRRRRRRRTPRKQPCPIGSDFRKRNSCIPPD